MLEGELPEVKAHCVFLLLLSLTAFMSLCMQNESAIKDQRDTRKPLLVLLPFTHEQTEAQGASMVLYKGLNFGIRFDSVLVTT